MTCDLDRLHKVVTGELTGKGCGKTYAQIQEIISSVQLGCCKHVIVFVDFLKDVPDIHRSIIQAVKLTNINIDWVKEQELSINGVVVRFKLRNESIRGYDNYYLIDMGR